MGLSEEEKARHPYYMEKTAKAEKERWEKFTKSPEYLKILEKYQRAVEDHLHQLVMADFHARDLKITVEQVASATSFWTARLCDSLMRSKFYFTERMLERFDLVKKKKSE